MDGSRRQSITFFLILPSPCVSATLVVVLPSPALVGVIAVTMTSLPSGSPPAAEDRELHLPPAVPEDLQLLRQDAGGRGDIGNGAQFWMSGVSSSTSSSVRFFLSFRG